MMAAPVAPTSTAATAPDPSAELGLATRAGPIVLGTDLRPEAAAPENRALDLAVSAGRPVVVVHAIDAARLRLPGGRFLQRIDQVRATRQSAAERLLERARARRIDARLLIWEGDPASCIVDAARAEGAALIVIGSHGRGRLGRAIAGSVSADVLAAADCPVHVVPVGRG
jgi:nucleotide-binding universal stress UspA family protein